jgi:hypothetical protein
MSVRSAALLPPDGSQAVLAECDLRTSAQGVGLPLRSAQRNVKLHRADSVVWRSLRRDSGVDGVRAEGPRQKRPLCPHRAVLCREQARVTRSCALVVVLAAAVANVPRQPPKSGCAVILCAEKYGSRQTYSHDDYHQQDCERDPIQKAAGPLAQGRLGSQPDRVIDAPDPIHGSIVRLDTPELVDSPCPRTVAKPLSQYRSWQTRTTAHTPRSREVRGLPQEASSPESLSTVTTSSRPRTCSDRNPKMRAASTFTARSSKKRTRSGLHGMRSATAW